MAASAMAALVPAHPAFAAEMCWTSQELRDAQGGEAIHKDVAAAYVPVPRVAVAATPATFRPIKGVIRRVKLPADAPKLVALTFDLCEQAHEVSGYQGRIVDFLRDRSIKATFFAGGKWMLTHSRRAQQLMSDPLFEVANHSWEHRNFRTIASSRLGDEIRGAQAAYELARAQLVDRRCLARDGEELPKSVPARMSLFRFPFGACNAAALQAVGAHGLYAVQWDVSSGDPDRNVGARAMAARVARAVRPGSIVIFHANGRGWSTAEALPAIVSQLSAAGFRFATVSELLTYPGADWEIADTCYDARPHDTDRYDFLARTLEARYERYYSRFSPAGSARSQVARRPVPRFDTQVRKE